jgi:hypothetical protein
LASPAIARLGEIALGCLGSLRSAGHPAHIDIEELLSPLVGMTIALAVLAIESGQRAGQLLDGDVSCGIQRRLDSRLVRAPISAKGFLQGRVRAQARIGFDQAVGTGQDGDEGIGQLVHRGVHDRLLLNLHLLTNGSQEVDLPQVQPKCRQRRVRGERHIRSGGRLGHDGPPVLGCQPWNRYGPSSVFPQQHHLPKHPAINWGQY